MITIEPEPMKGPPSWRCQIGAGNLARSTSLSLIVCCKKAASLTTAGARGCSALRFSIQALSASSGRNVGSMPSASAARCGLVVALVKMRKPRGKPLMASNRSAGPSGRPAATSVTAPISKRGFAPSMRRSAPSLSTSSMNSRKSLYIPFAPAAADAEDSSLRALWSGAVPRYSSSPRRLKKDKGHGQASPHRAHRSRSGKGRQVFRGRLRHEGGGQGPARALRLRRHRQRRAAQAGRGREGRHLPLRDVGGRSRRSGEEGRGRGRQVSCRPAGAGGSWRQRALLLRGQVQGSARHRVRPHPHRLGRRREGRGGREELRSRETRTFSRQARSAPLPLGADEEGVFFANRRINSSAADLLSRARKKERNEKR